MLRSQVDLASYAQEFDKLVSTNFIFKDNPPNSFLKQISNAELIVPVIGAFSAGKSTLINSLLEHQLLPVGIAPETELATELRYADEEYLIGIKPDGSEERFHIDSLSDANRRSSEFSFLRIYLNNDSLKKIHPLVLVDMPGFGSSLENHNKALNFYMPRGVHFIVVTSVEDGTLTRSMLRQLDQIQRYQASFTFFLSKANLRPNDQVAEVQEYIKDQLEINSCSNASVTPVSLDDGMLLTKALQALNPEGMFLALFLDKLKEQNIETIEQINLALQTINQEAHQREEQLSKLENALEELNAQRDRSINDVRDKFSSRTQSQCLKKVEEALVGSIDSFVSLALRGNSKALSNAILEEIQHTLEDCIRIELESAASTFVDDLTGKLALVSEGILSANGGDWSRDLGVKVSSSLQKTKEVLGGWQTALGKDAATKAGGLYRVVSTMLSVTTSVLNPVVELLIIFLPDILRLFTKNNEQAMVREKLLTETFPDIKAELRKGLPGVLEQELQRLLNTITNEFEERIVTQREAIAKLSAEYASNKEDHTNKKNELETLRAGLQDLAKRYLDVAVEA